MTIGSSSGIVWAVLGALFVFGFFYDRFVAWMEREGYDEGFTAILVTFGVLATLLGYGVLVYAAFELGVCVDGGAALATTAITLLALLGCFGASGFWMIVGSVWRYIERRHNGQVFNTVVETDDEGTRLAE